MVFSPMYLFSLVFLTSALCVDAQDPMMTLPPMMTPEPMVTPGPVESPFDIPPTTWENAYFRGTPNNFGFASMTLVNGLWRTNQTFPDTSGNRFKIARYMDWSEAYPASDYYITQGPGDYAITFNDSSKEITVVKIDGTVIIQFQCDKGLTTPGTSVYVTGSVPELGSWKRANAVVLSSSTYPSWRKTIPIKIGQTVSWKCLKRLEGNPNANVAYEPGMNNMFTATVPTTVFGSF